LREKTTAEGRTRPRHAQAGGTKKRSRRQTRRRQDPGNANKKRVGSSGREGTGKWLVKKSRAHVKTFTRGRRRTDRSVGSRGPTKPRSFPIRKESRRKQKAGGGQVSMDVRRKSRKGNRASRGDQGSRAEVIEDLCQLQKSMVVNQNGGVRKWLKSVGIC